MRYLLLLLLFVMAGCAGTAINCDDATQMLSSDQQVRYQWLQQCKDANRKVTVNGEEQAPR